MEVESTLNFVPLIRTKNYSTIVSTYTKNNDSPKSFNSSLLVNNLLDVYTETR